MKTYRCTNSNIFRPCRAGVMGENFIVPGLRPGLIYDALSGHDIICIQRQEARKIRAQGNALGKGSYTINGKP